LKLLNTFSESQVEKKLYEEIYIKDNKDKIFDIRIYPDNVFKIKDVGGSDLIKKTINRLLEI